MTTARPPAPTPAVGPATCHAAANLAEAAIGLLASDRTELRAADGDTVSRVDEQPPTAEARAEAARMLRTAAELVAPGPPTVRPPAMRGRLEVDPSLDAASVDDFMERFYTPELMSPPDRPAAGPATGSSTSTSTTGPATDPANTGNSGQDDGGDSDGPISVPGRRITPIDVARATQRRRGRPA